MNGFWTLTTMMMMIPGILARCGSRTYDMRSVLIMPVLRPGTIGSPAIRLSMCWHSFCAVIDGKQMLAEWCFRFWLALCHLILSLVRCCNITINHGVLLWLSMSQWSSRKCDGADVTEYSVIVATAVRCCQDRVTSPALCRCSRQVWIVSAQRIWNLNNFTLNILCKWI